MEDEKQTQQQQQNFTQGCTSAKRLDKRTVHEGKWLRTCAVDFQSETGKECKAWEMVERTRTLPDCVCNGVEILPIVKFSDGRRQLMFIANYRAPMDRYCVEFPSGLMDDSDVIENAKRELKEETGYVAEEIQELDFSPVLCVDPWKSNETTKIVVAYIDGDNPINQNPKQDLESDENIHPFFVDINGSFVENLKKIAEKNNYILTQAIYTLCLGVQLMGLAK